MGSFSQIQEDPPNAGPTSLPLALRIHIRKTTGQTRRHRQSRAQQATECDRLCPQAPRHAQKPVHAPRPSTGRTSEWWCAPPPPRRAAAVWCHCARRVPSPRARCRAAGRCGGMAAAQSGLGPRPSLAARYVPPHLRHLACGAFQEFCGFANGDGPQRLRPTRTRRVCAGKIARRLLGEHRKILDCGTRLQPLPGLPEGSFRNHVCGPAFMLHEEFAKVNPHNAQYE